MVHAFYEVGSDCSVFWWKDLEHAFFNVFFEIPSNNENNILLVILGLYLQTVVLRRLHNLWYFCIIWKSKLHILQNFTIDFFKFVFFLVWVPFYSTEFQIITAINYNQVIIEKLRKSLFWVFLIQFYEVLVNVFVLSIVM